MKKTIKIIFVLMFISLIFILFVSEIEAKELLRLRDFDGQLGIRINDKIAKKDAIYGYLSKILTEEKDEKGVSWFVGLPTERQIKDTSTSIFGDSAAYDSWVVKFLEGPYITIVTNYKKETIKSEIKEELVIEDLTLKVIEGKLSVSGEDIADMGNLFDPKIKAEEIAVGNCMVEFSSTTKRITFEDEGYFRRKIKGIAESYEAEVIDGEKSGLVVDYNYEGGYVTKKLYESLIIRGEQEFRFVWQPIAMGRLLEPWERVSMKNMASWLEIDSISKKDDNKVRLYSHGMYRFQTKAMEEAKYIKKGETIFNITKEGFILLSLGGVRPSIFGEESYAYLSKEDGEIYVDASQAQYLCAASDFEGIKVEQLVEKTEQEINREMALAEHSSSLVQQLAEGISKEEIRAIKSSLLEYAVLKNRETSFTEICQLHNLGCDEVKQIGAEKKEIESEWSLFAPVFALVEKLPSPISTVVEKNDVKIVQAGSVADAYKEVTAYEVEVIA